MLRQLLSRLAATVPAHLARGPSAHPTEPTVGFNHDLWTGRIQQEHAAKAFLNLGYAPRTPSFSFVEQLQKERAGKATRPSHSFAENLQPGSPSMDPSFSFAAREGIRSTRASAGPQF
jgi:hypothetical protein